LAGLSESELARKRMQRGLRAALAYPVLVLTFLTFVLILMSFTVNPQFKEIFDDFYLDLPAVTEFAFAVSETLPLILLALAIFVFIVLFIGTNFLGSRYLYWIRSALPLLGRAWIWSGQHEFATLMATLTSQQVPTAEALACTSESLRDRNLAWAARQASEKCGQGTSLGQSLRESIHFDPTLTSLAEWGETHQSLPQAMREAAKTYEQQMELYTQFLYRILPPLMLSIVATALFLIVASMFLPLVQMTNGFMG